MPIASCRRRGGAGSCRAPGRGERVVNRFSWLFLSAVGMPGDAAGLAAPWAVVAVTDRRVEGKPAAEFGRPAHRLQAAVVVGVGELGFQFGAPLRGDDIAQQIAVIEDHRRGHRVEAMNDWRRGGVHS